MNSETRAPVLIAGLAGALMVANTSSTSDTQDLGPGNAELGVIIAAFALGLAAVSLIRTHGRRIVERRGEWYNSILLVGAMFITAISGIIGRDTATFRFIFEDMITPLGSAFYSMVAYYLLSAAYRTFRARSFEATALLLAGIIVMLGRAR